MRDAMTLTPQDFTPKLALPFLLPGQAQKHVTLNESLRAIDALLMGAVEASDIAQPPADPESGQAWILPENPAGVWADHAYELAVWQDGAWAFYPPQDGWRVWSKAGGALLVYETGVWRAIEAGATERVEQLGIGADPDAANTFAAKLNGALFTADETSGGGTGDLRISLNKEAPGNLLSLLFQTGYEGRAEIGLTDSDALAVRVSDDGTVWSDALIVDHATGHIGIGQAADDGDTLSVRDRLTVSGDDGYFTLKGSGTVDMARNTGGPIYLRTRSPGSNLSFGATDSGGSLTNGAVVIRADQQDVLFKFSPAPASSGDIDLGSGSRAFRDLYLTNAPTIASDVRGKHEVEPFRQGLELINLLMPVTYMRDDGEPYHVGLIAQQVKLALQRSGLEGSAIWRLADEDDADSLQSVSYTELIPALIDAVQELTMRIEDLERVAA